MFPPLAGNSPHLITCANRKGFYRKRSDLIVSIEASNDIKGINWFQKHNRKGRLVSGDVHEVSIVAFNGRFHGIKDPQLYFPRAVPHILYVL